MPADELTLQRRTLKREACEILGIDRTKVRLLRVTRLQQLRAGPDPLFGQADRPTNTIHTRGRTGFITYVHELLHLLFSGTERTHMWVFGAAYILADCPQRAMAESLLAAALIRESKASLQAQARAQARKVGLA